MFVYKNIHDFRSTVHRCSLPITCLSLIHVDLEFLPHVNAALNKKTNEISFLFLRLIRLTSTVRLNLPQKNTDRDRDKENLGKLTTSVVMEALWNKAKSRHEAAVW